MKVWPQMELPRLTGEVSAIRCKRPKPRIATILEYRLHSLKSRHAENKNRTSIFMVFGLSNIMDRGYSALNAEKSQSTVKMNLIPHILQIERIPQLLPQPKPPRIM